jgi:hypothetical protein
MKAEVLGEMAEQISLPGIDWRTDLDTNHQLLAAYLHVCMCCTFAKSLNFR